MRKLFAVALMAFGALAAAPIQAADLPDYPEIEVPDVDYGMGGSFYLRGSASWNVLTTPRMDYDCLICGGPTTFDAEDVGYGYSIGAGFGYETGDGLRADVTLDYLRNDGLYVDPPANVELSLRSTIALANIYYDFPLSGSSAAGGFGAYVGAGVGAAFNHVEDTATTPAPEGDSVEAAGALMAGFSYDMGQLVADVGYRGIYMPRITNDFNGTGDFAFEHGMVHELRGTVRYRLQ